MKMWNKNTPKFIWIVWHLKGLRDFTFTKIWLKDCDVISAIISFDSKKGYGITAGQNIAWDQSSWDSAIQAWLDEVKDFTYGVDASRAAHYAQVILPTHH